MLTYLNFFTDNIDPKQIIDEVKPYINTILPIIFGLTGLFCAVKCAIIGYHIAKTADEPEKRSEYIKSLIWPIVGLVVSVVIPTIVTVVIDGLSSPQV